MYQQVNCHVHISNQSTIKSHDNHVKPSVNSRPCCMKHTARCYYSKVPVLNKFRSVILGKGIRHDDTFSQGNKVAKKSGHVGVGWMKFENEGWDGCRGGGGIKGWIKINFWMQCVIMTQITWPILPPTICVISRFSAISKVF